MVTVSKQYRINALFEKIQINLFPLPMGKAGPSMMAGCVSKTGAALSGRGRRWAARYRFTAHALPAQRARRKCFPAVLPLYNSSMSKHGAVTACQLVVKPSGTTSVANKKAPQLLHCGAFPFPAWRGRKRAGRSLVCLCKELKLLQLRRTSSSDIARSRHKPVLWRGGIRHRLARAFCFHSRSKSAASSAERP